MARRSVADIEKIWSNVEGVKKLSDRAVGIGPFGVGLDGLLTWIPVVGTVYSVGAAAWLLVQASRARATPSTLFRMVSYLGLDSATTAVGEVIPFAPDVVDFFFPGHLLAAGALQKDIVRRFGPPQEAMRPAGASSTADPRSAPGSAPQGA